MKQAAAVLHVLVVLSPFAIVVALCVWVALQYALVADTLAGLVP